MKTKGFRKRKLAVRRNLKQQVAPLLIDGPVEYSHCCYRSKEALSSGVLLLRLPKFGSNENFEICEIIQEMRAVWDN